MEKTLCLRFCQVEEAHGCKLGEVEEERLFGLGKVEEQSLCWNREKGGE